MPNCDCVQLLKAGFIRRSQVAWGFIPRRRDETAPPVTADDESLLYELYVTTRAVDLAAVDWDDPQQETFLRRQSRGSFVGDAFDAGTR